MLLDLSEREREIGSGSNRIELNSGECFLRSLIEDGGLAGKLS